MAWRYKESNSKKILNFLQDNSTAPKIELPKMEIPKPMGVPEMDPNKIEMPKPIKQSDPVAGAQNLFAPEAPLSETVEPDQQEQENKVAELEEQIEQDRIKEEEAEERFRQQQREAMERARENSMSSKRDTDVMIRLAQVAERQQALRQQKNEDAQKNQDSLREKLEAQRAESLKIAREELEFAEKTGLGLDQVRGRFSRQPEQSERYVEDYIPSPAYPREMREVKRPMEESYESLQERELSKIMKQSLLQRQQDELNDALETRRMQNELRRLEIESKKREYAIANARLEAQLKGYGIGNENTPQQQKPAMDPASLLMLMQNPQLKESFKGMDLAEVMKLSLLMNGMGSGQSPMLTLMLLNQMGGPKQPTAAPEDQFVKLMGIVQAMQPKQDDGLNKLYLELLKAQIEKTDHALAAQGQKTDELRNSLVQTQLNQMQAMAENNQKLLLKDIDHLKEGRKENGDPIDNFFAMHDKLQKVGAVLGGAAKEPGMVEKIGAIAQPIVKELVPAITEVVKGNNAQNLLNGEIRKREQELQAMQLQLHLQQQQQQTQQNAIQHPPAPQPGMEMGDNAVNYQGQQPPAPRKRSSFIPRDEPDEEDEGQPPQNPPSA